MKHNHEHVSLGFAEQTVPVGTHMCLIFTSEEERTNSLLKFLLSGLQSGERSACFSENITEESVRNFFAENNISYDERKKSGAITLAGTREVYFLNGEFNPARMLHNISTFYQESMDKGFPASRIIGEMVPEIESISGGNRLMEYECKVSILLRDNPVTTVCLYDAKKFDGATIMDILKVHPKMIVGGTVIQNPFFIEPEAYLDEMVN